MLSLTIKAPTLQIVPQWQEIALDISHGPTLIGPMVTLATSSAPPGSLHFLNDVLEDNCP